MSPSSKSLAIAAIRKKLVGKRLSYQEIFALMDEIGKRRLGPILTTYFAAAGFKEGFTQEELYYLTKAMAETGDKLRFSGIVADKHSTGGVAGTRTTMILVPIIAAAGIKIPKNSSRAITSPSGTADTMEVLAPVTFAPHQIEKIVKKVGGCIVWGGHLGLAPADDVIIQVEEPLAFESFDKIIVSVMAKKVASGATHVVIDIPVGPTVKIKHFADAEVIGKKFIYLGKKFGIKIALDINHTLEPAGRGVGPALEARDVLRVLEQRKNRPLALERKALRLSGKLLDLCFADLKRKKTESGEEIAREILTSGKALEKMKQIIQAQGGNPKISSDKLRLGKYKIEVKSVEKGRITSIDNHQITVVCRILGTPEDKQAGIFLEKRLEEKIDKGDILFIMYSDDRWRLKEAKETLKNLPIYKVE
ncbi:thymidine phosphorylase [Candidatus Gottesmanbacteria bacterium]|nr:thymidine phosphorylase [Candidatus Gottesmanbacteria bacterium]